jgi:hypothetical protein
MYSRRDFGKLAIAGAPLSMAFGAAGDSSVGGVRIGATTFSLRELPRTPGKDAVDDVIHALQFAGVREVDLSAADTEAPAPDTRLPPPAAPSVYGGPVAAVSPEEAAMVKKIIRESFRQWRIYTPAAYYQTIRAKFDAAGIELYAYTMNFDEQFTDDEIDGVFRQAKTLGVGVISSATTLATARRLAPFAARHDMLVALRNLPNALELSDRFRVAFDISRHDDPVAFLNANHDRISHAIVADRTKATGAAEKFGEGDTPIKTILSQIKNKKYPIRAYVEYAYFGLGAAPEELKKCMMYVRSSLG